MKTGIYKITNKINGKFYIGSSKDLVRRKDHFRLLKKGVNHSILMTKTKEKEIALLAPYTIIGNSAKRFGGQKIIFIKRVFRFIKLTI